MICRGIAIVKVVPEREVWDADRIFDLGDPLDSVIGCPTERCRLPISSEASRSVREHQT
jgi:hypothetical protein